MVKRKWLAAVTAAIFCLSAVMLAACGEKGEKPGETPYEYDFTLELPAGEVDILIMNDTQVIDSSQGRELFGADKTNYTPDKIDERLFRYMDDAVAQGDPDLIVLGGDNVYADFDFDFSNIDKFIAKMESYGKPWITVFGNHDLYPYPNHPTLTNSQYIDEVLKKYEAAEHCMFQRTGVSELRFNEYTLGIKQDGKYTLSLFFVDTGDGSRGGIGVTSKQCTWLEETSAKIQKSYGNVPAHVYLHVAVPAFVDSLDEMYPGDWYAGGILGSENLPAKNGDFGRIDNLSELGSSAYGEKFFDICTENRVTNMFAAHNHKASFSVLYRDVRLTMGLKTGEYDSHLQNFLGATRARISEGRTTVEHLYFSGNN